MASNNRQVKQILINKEFQMKFITINGILISVMSLIYAISIEFFFSKFLTLGEKAGLPTDHVFFDFILKQRLEIFIFFLITYIIVLAIFLYAALKMSHKVAGPMYRMNLHLNEIANEGGKLKPIKFRENDYFIEIQDSFNNVVDKQNKSNS